MIRIVQGNPGSGKSYYCVNYIAKFCDYDNLYGEHILKHNTLVITNIENLKIKHLNLDDLIQRFTVEKFFTVENFEIIMAKYKVNHIIVAIDEAQKIFDSKFYDKDVFYFFQYHRHLGIDIFFLTQNVSLICRQIPPLSEFIVDAVPRSKGISGMFRYRMLDSKGFHMYSKGVAKVQNIFKMYQSFKSDEAEKPKNVLMHWIVICSVAFLVCFVGFKVFFNSYSNRNDKVTVNGVKNVPKQLPASPVPVAAPGNGNIPVPGSAVVPGVVGQPVSPVPVSVPASSGDFIKSALGDVVSTNSGGEVIGKVSGEGVRAKYLLASGRVVESSRSLSIGNVYAP